MSLDAKKQPWSPSISARLEDSTVASLFDELDCDKSGFVSKKIIVDTFLRVYADLAPSPKPYHLLHSSRANDLATFIRALFPDCEDALEEGPTQKFYDLQQFKSLLKRWDLPSLNSARKRLDHTGEQPVPASAIDSCYLQRLRTKWSTNRYRYLYIVLVLCLQLGFGLWQFFAFYRDDQARDAFGTGMLVAKAAAGALYPTLSLMVLSMSRWLQNVLRRNRHLRRFIDWEYARNFHIKMACLAFLLGIVHAIAHLTGTYRHALHHPEPLAKQIWQRPGTPLPSTYLDFMKWRASWTGWSSLGIFFIMSLGGSPFIRRRYFELFQWSHLLMFPLFVMLLTHGSGAILNAPMLGWWLLFPISLILTEKLYRLVRGFISLETTALSVEDDMVALSIRVGWNATQYRTGQYVFLQVPAISRIEWHPFTVSTIIENRITLHIRTSAGDWTSALSALAKKGVSFVTAIDGPYGSPSREFYRYDKTIIFGAGIGITPFSAILYDLSEKLENNQSPWKRDWRSMERSLKRERQAQTEQESESPDSPTSDMIDIDPSGNHSSIEFPGTIRTASLSSEYQVDRRGPTSPDESLAAIAERHVSYLKSVLQKRSISLHWTVRKSQDLQWLSSLLNRLTPDLSVKIDVNLYVTKSSKEEKPSTLVFRSLLDNRRILSLQSSSFLTGLPQTCQFWRPNFEDILDNYHHELLNNLVTGQGQAKVGIIFCGPIALGNVLSSRCHVLTGRARVDGSRVRYFYHSESF